MNNCNEKLNEKANLNRKHPKGQHKSDDCSHVLFRA